MTSAKRPATYEDLCAVPDHLVAEIVDGELIVSPRPALPHTAVTSRLGAQLGGSFDGPENGPDAPGGWIVLYEPELHLGRDVLVPDLAAWRRSRMPRIPDAPYPPVAPDWVCEILSPRNAPLDRARKLPIYAREGIGHAWLVDPAVRTLEVFRLVEGRWVLAAVHAGDEPVRAEPFEAVALASARWWADVEPTAASPA